MIVSLPFRRRLSITDNLTPAMGRYHHSGRIATIILLIISPLSLCLLNI